MKLPYFVMLQHPNGGIVPMTDDFDDLATFETEGEAKAAADNSSLGAHFGYEVFERGCGANEKLTGSRLRLSSEQSERGSAPC